jgi:hypothetical protein
MANELLKNAEGDAVPQKLADGTSVSASDLNGDDTVWAIFDDPAQGGGSTLNDIVTQLQNGAFGIDTISDNIALEADDGEGTSGDIYRTNNALHTYETNTLSAEAFENGTSLSSGSTLSTSLSQAGARKLSGIVTRATTSYDIQINWLDSAGGNVVQTESIASGVAGGTQTTFDVPARSPYAQVQVIDAGSGSGEVNGSYHLR